MRIGRVFLIDVILNPVIMSKNREVSMNRILVIVILLTLSLCVWADNLDETLESLSGQAAKSYVGPVVSTLGSNLNGGWFHKAPKSKLLGIDFELGIVAMMTSFNDEDEDFSTKGYFQFTQQQAEEIVANDPDIPDMIEDQVVDAIVAQEFEVQINGPTIVGSANDEIEIVFPQQDVEYAENLSQPVAEYTVKTGVSGLIDDLEALPMFAPQLSIGTVYGTCLTLRALPPFEIEDLGEVTYFGGGIQHNIKAWLPAPLPLDISLSAFFQTLKLGEYVEANGMTAGFNVSKSFGTKMLSVTPYAGVMLEKYTMDFSYEYEIAENQVGVDPVNIDFSVEGENSYRMTVGASFKLGFSHLNVDYNIGEYNSITAGLAFAF